MNKSQLIDDNILSHVQNTFKGAFGNLGNTSKHGFVSFNKFQAPQNATYHLVNQ